MAIRTRVCFFGGGCAVALAAWGVATLGSCSEDEPPNVSYVLCPNDPPLAGTPCPQEAVGLRCTYVGSRGQGAFCEATCSGEGSWQLSAGCDDGGQGGMGAAGGAGGGAGQGGQSVGGGPAGGAGTTGGGGALGGGGWPAGGAGGAGGF